MVLQLGVIVVVRVDIPDQIRIFINTPILFYKLTNPCGKTGSRSGRTGRKQDFISSQRFHNFHVANGANLSLGISHRLLLIHLDV